MPSTSSFCHQGNCANRRPTLESVFLPCSAEDLIMTPENVSIAPHLRTCIPTFSTRAPSIQPGHDLKHCNLHRLARVPGADCFRGFFAPVGAIVRAPCPAGVGPRRKPFLGAGRAAMGSGRRARPHDRRSFRQVLVLELGERREEAGGGVQVVPCEVLHEPLDERRPAHAVAESSRQPKRQRNDGHSD